MRGVFTIPLLLLLLHVHFSSAASGDEYWDGRYRASGASQGGVRAITVQGRNVFIGGGFSEIGGVPANNIARWDGTNWWALGIGVDGPVYSLAAHGNNLYVGGAFETAGGTTAAHVAQWDGTNWAAVGERSFPFHVVALAVSTNGNEVYAGHQEIGAAGGRYIFKFDGTDWTPLGGGIYYNDALSTPVGAIAVDGNDVFLGGQFRNVGGVEATNLARWDGTNWWPVGGGVEFDVPGIGTTLKVAALAVAGGKLYVGGNFTRTGDAIDSNVSNIARWDGTNWFTFGRGVGFTVRALVVNGAEVYAGGTIRNEARGFAAPGIAKWDGANWTPLGSGLSDPNYGVAMALGLRGADLFTGGIFSIAGGKPAEDLAIWHIPQSLQIALMTGKFLISWPTQAVNYVLQSSTVLSQSAWSAFPQVPQIVNGRYTVMSDLFGESSFFRLTQP